MNMTREDLINLSNQMTRFAVPTKILINENFLNAMYSSGAIKKGEGMPSLEGIRMEIDNTVDNFKFEY